jgi:phosphoglycolate phosphatase-like HAD superfamily hydrolase
MSSLAIFDIDGTLTDTNAVDGACYRSAVAEALGVSESALDWTKAPHFSDRGIFEWLWDRHGGRPPTDAEVAQARDRLIELLSAEVVTSPARFAPIAGAPRVFDRVRAEGWSVSIATGCWSPSARIKLRAAGIDLDDALIACSDDAAARTDIVRRSRELAESYYGREFDRVVSIGDGLWDVETAALLELPFIGVGRGERRARLERAGASVVIEDYSHLAAFMTALAEARVPGSA